MTRKTKITALIFDLGRVLVDVDFSDLFKKYTNTPGKKADLETMMKFPWFIEFSSGKCSFDTFYQNVKRHYNFELSAEQFRFEWSQVFRPMPQMENLVYWAAEHYPVGLLSDTDEVHWEYLLENYPLLKIFRQPVLSFRIKKMKPALECYLQAAASVGRPAQECLFIDDRSCNVQGALNAGMQAILFESFDQLTDYLRKEDILMIK